MQAEDARAENDKRDRGVYCHFGIRTETIKRLNVVDVAKQTQQGNEKRNDCEGLDAWLKQARLA